MQHDAVLDLIRQEKLIVIVRGVSPDQVVALGEALYAGGIRLMEITFDQSSAQGIADTLESIRRLCGALGDKMAIGAGTVLTVKQVKLAKKAGASFIISPDAVPAVIRATRKAGLVSLPGALTPTEITAAYAAGADMVKVFPVKSMGAGYIKDLLAPLRHIPLLAVGGISKENVAQYLQEGAKGFGVGGSLVDKSLIAAGDWAGITANAAAFVDAIGKEGKA